MSLKRRITYILIIFLLLSYPAYIKAQDDDNSSSKTGVIRMEKINRLEVLKQKRQEAKEKFATKREEFKTKLLEIKNKNKQLIVERIDKRITALNKKHTDRFNSLLEKLSSILDRIETKSSELESGGVNVTTLSVAIQNARDAIDVAQTEVESQAGKDYIIVINTESNLGEVVSSAFKEFRDDMKALQDSVKVARDAVKNAANTLKDLIKSSNTTDESAE